MRATCRTERGRPLAHLLVNGDVPSFVLFGGLLAWAVIILALVGKRSCRC